MRRRKKRSLASRGRKRNAKKNLVWKTEDKMTDEDDDTITNHAVVMKYANMSDMAKKKETKVVGRSIATHEDSYDKFRGDKTPKQIIDQVVNAKNRTKRSKSSKKAGISRKGRRKKRKKAMPIRESKKQKLINDNIPQGYSVHYQVPYGNPPSRNVSSASLNLEGDEEDSLLLPSASKKQLTNKKLQERLERQEQRRRKQEEQTHKFVQQSEVVKEIFVNNSLNVVSAANRNLHDIDLSKDINVQETVKNIEDATEESVKMEPKLRRLIDPMIVRDLARAKLYSMLEHIMKKQEDDHPIRKLTRGMDSDLLDEEINVSEPPMHQINPSNMNNANWNCIQIIQGSVNNVSKAEKTGNSNNSHDLIPSLSVDEVNDLSREADETKLNENGERIEFVCSNASQKDETSTEYKTNPVLNRCKAWEYSGHAITLRAAPNRHNHKMTQRTREKCLFCVLAETKEIFDRWMMNQEESEIIIQKFAFQINKPVTDNRQRSFKSRAMLRKGSESVGIPLPHLSFDMTHFVREDNHTQRSDPRNNVPLKGYFVREEKVFPIESSKLRSNLNTVDIISPNVCYSSSIAFPDTWTLLLYNLKNIVSTKEDLDEVAGDQKYWRITPPEAEFLEQVMMNKNLRMDNFSHMLELFYDNVNMPPVEVMNPAERTEITFYKFLDMNIKDFYILFQKRFKYCYWNPFRNINNYPDLTFDVGAKKVSDYPLVALLMIRVNMVLHTISRLRIALQYEYDQKKAKFKIDWNEKNSNDMIHYSNFNIPLDRLQSTEELRQYYFLKRLRHFYAAHFTAMSLVEYCIQVESQYMPLLNNQKFWDCILPRRIKYEYSPFDEKHIKVKRRKHVKEAPIKIAMRLTGELGDNIFKNGMPYFGMLETEWLTGDLLQVAKKFREHIMKFEKPADVANLVQQRLFPNLTHFFPQTKDMSYSIFNNGVKGLQNLMKIWSRRHRSHWNEMQLINISLDRASYRDALVDIGDDFAMTKSPSEGRGGFVYFHPLDHSVFWCWLIRINLLQRKIEDVTNLREREGTELYKTAQEFVKNLKGKKNKMTDESARDELLDFPWTIDLLKEMMEEIDTKFTKKSGGVQRDTKLMEASYQYYVELNNHAALGVEMFLNQVYSDRLLLTYHKKEESETRKTGFYQNACPHPTRTLTSDCLPNISPLLWCEQLSYKTRDRNEYSIIRALKKAHPTRCQIRLITTMILKAFRENLHTRKYLLGIIWCNIMGMYRDSDHSVMSWNFTRILQAHRDYFSLHEIDGKNRDQRRMDIFQRIRKNKYVIHDILRKQTVYHLVRYLPSLVDFYRSVWTGPPFIRWENYQFSSSLNANFLLGYFAEYGKTPEGPEVIDSSEKKTLINRIKRKDNTMKVVVKKIRKNPNVKKIYDQIIKRTDDIGDTSRRRITTGSREDKMEEYLGDVSEMYYQFCCNQTNSKEEKSLLSQAMKCLLGMEMEELYWSQFLKRKRNEIDTSIGAYIRGTQRSVGIHGSYYILQKQIRRTIKELNKTAVGPSRRIWPLIGSGIYRIYKHSYVRTMIDVFRVWFEEKLVCNMFSDLPIPMWLLYPLEEDMKITIDKCPHLGLLTRNPKRHHEIVFKYLHDHCGLSYPGYSLLSDSYRNYTDKLSENKIKINLRPLFDRDFCIIKYYFEIDHKKNQVVTETDHSTDYVRLYTTLKKHEKSWTNVASMDNEVFQQRNGFDPNNLPFDYTKRPPNHYTQYSTCCSTIKTYPANKGFGQSKTYNSVKIDDRSLLDVYLDVLFCTCNLFSGNQVQCPVHKSYLSTSDNLSCSSFSKSEYKKLKRKKSELDKKLQEMVRKIDDIPKKGGGMYFFRQKLKGVRDKNKKIIMNLSGGLTEKEYNKLVQRNKEYIDCVSKRILYSKEDGTIAIGTKDDDISEDIIKKEQRKALRRAKKEAMKDENQDDDETEGESEDDDDNDDDEDETYEEKMEDEDEESEEDDKKKKRKKKDNNIIDRVRSARLIPFSDFQMGKSNKDAPKKERQKRRSDSLREKVEKNITGVVRKLGSCLHRCYTSYACSDPVKRKLKKELTFGKLMIVMSDKEVVSTYTWCSKCGSMARQNHALYQGDKYVCASCWCRYPEGCAHFIDDITSDVVFVPIHDQITLCGQILYPDENKELKKRKGKKKKQSMLEKTRKMPKFITRTIERDEMEDEDAMEKSGDNIIEVDTIKTEEELEEMLRMNILIDEKRQAEQNVTELDQKQRRKNRQKVNDVLVEICLGMRRSCLLNFMKVFLVFDDKSDPNVENVITYISTSRKKWKYTTGFFKPDNRVFVKSVFFDVYRNYKEYARKLRALERQN